MRKMLAVLALTVAATLLLAGPAAAGEITGKGQPTPIAEYKAASICSFSGLNDTYSGDPAVPDAEGFFRTQSWGQLPKSLRDQVRAGNSPDPEHLQAPDVACNARPSDDGVLPPGLVDPTTTFA